MAIEDADDFAPEDTENTGVTNEKKGRKAFGKVKREITEKDLQNPAIQKMLLDELDRLETESEEYKQYKERYHKADKRVAVLEEKSKGTLAIDILSGACLTIGAASLGYTKILWENQPSGYIALVVGGVLIAAGIAAKVVKR